MIKHTREWPSGHPIPPSADTDSEERKQTQLFNVILLEDNPLLTRFSSLNKLLFLTTQARRWRHRTKGDVVPSTQEKEHALLHWVRLIQQEAFPSEWKALCNGNAISSRSRLQQLKPQWCAKDEVIRVGGRLRNACIAEDAKHPMVLPSKGHMSWLVINEAHEKVLHGGVQVTVRYIRKRFWILHDRQTVKSQLKKCVRCFRFRQKFSGQQMGDLPSMRVQINRPFRHTGVDFAGYFEVKLNALRSTRFTKCYVAIFICLTTKAVHLELVCDLSTRAFADALKKFTARKGIPAHIYSDNGTNFVGASNELPRIFHDAASKTGQMVAQELLKDNIQWHFNPAHAPHFGGIWEGNVRVMKMHLNRVLKDRKIYYDDFHTILCQIEAIMNSRPLCPLSDDVDDDEALTPSHLLVGYGINTLPETFAESDTTSAKSRYGEMRAIYQNFWKLWSQDYLTQLQQRTKWNVVRPNVHVGQLALLKDDNLPPSRWLTGRITQVFPGADSLIRAVELKCGKSIVTRPIHKLCVLPIDA